MSALEAAGVSPRGYSQTVAIDLGRAERLVVVSGQIAVDDEGAIVGEGDFGAQCRYVFAQLRRRLEEAGARLEDVAKLTIFLRDFSGYAALVKERLELFPAERPPASSVVAVASLVDDRLLIEVEALAVVPRRANEER